MMVIALTSVFLSVFLTPSIFQHPWFLLSLILYILSLAKLFLISNRGFYKISTLICHCATKTRLCSSTTCLRHQCSPTICLCYQCSSTTCLCYQCSPTTCLCHQCSPTTCLCFILICTRDALALAENMSNPMCRESRSIPYTCVVSFPQQVFNSLSFTKCKESKKKKKKRLLPFLFPQGL